MKYLMPLQAASSTQAYRGHLKDINDRIIGTWEAAERTYAVATKYISAFVCCESDGMTCEDPVMGTEEQPSVNDVISNNSE